MWKAYVHGADPRPEISARVLKVVTVLNGNIIPTLGLCGEDGEDGEDGTQVYYLLQSYQLGFAQSINAGGYDVEIVFED